MENLKILRKKYGYSQSELGNKIGFGQRAISKWENNDAEPDFEALKKLAIFFNCSIDYLLDYEQQKQPEQVEPNEKLNQIKNFSNIKSNCLEMLAEMSEEQSKLLQSYMQGLLGKEFNYFKN